MAGWTNSASLLAKHGQKLGDTLFSFLAAKDPETALEVDREKLEDDLRGAALKLAEARRLSAAATAKLDSLRASIEGDQKAAVVLLEKFELKEVDEATLTQFTDNLEDMQASLPDIERDAQDAKELADSIGEVVDLVKERLADFDQQAAQATRALARARSEKERQEMRAAQQAEVEALRSGTGTTSSALGSLGKMAAKLNDEAEAMKVVADVTQAPLDRANAVEEARRIASGTAAVSETAAQRLRRLAGQA